MLVLVLLAGLAACSGPETPAASRAFGETDFSSILATQDVTASRYLLLGKAADVTVTAGMAIAPAGSYQPIKSSGVVTATLSATGATAGQVLRLVNINASNVITLTDTGITKLAGDFGMGPADSLTAVFDGTNWIELARANN